MGGGDLEEDPKRELERLERDLAAIDARWAGEGYQQRTTSRVLDDERATRAEIEVRIMKLRTQSVASATPALGSSAVRALAGVKWEPLMMFERQAPDVPKEALPLVPLDVQAPPATASLDALRDELFALLHSSASSYPRLDELRARWSEVGEARRLLAAALRADRCPVTASSVWALPAAPRLPRRELRSLLITGALEKPDPVFGITETQRALLSLVQFVAPETRPFVPLSAVLAECATSLPSLDEKSLVRELASLGHPSLRAYPLVAFQGFAGRFDAHPSFTHVRITALGSEVVSGQCTWPLALMNGAAGAGSMLPPHHPAEVLHGMLNGRGHAFLLALKGCEFPNGAEHSVEQAVWKGRGSVIARATLEVHVAVEQRRARILVTKFPWPMTVNDVFENLLKVYGSGALDGVVRFVNESTSDEQRLSIELEHLVFAAQVREALLDSLVFEGFYPCAYDVAHTGAGGELSLEDMAERYREGLEAQIRRQFELQITHARTRARQQEALCVALELIDRVNAVLRDVFSDAEGEIALTQFLRPEDRPALERLPFPRSHDYLSGFTPDQARFIVKQKKLGARSKDAVRADWARALDEIEDAKFKASDRDEMLRSVRKTILELRDRFNAEPRRSKVFSLVYRK